MNKTLKIVIIVAALLLSAVLLVRGVGILTVCSLEGKTGIPTVSVNTQDGAEILSKEEYVRCKVSLKGAEEAFCFQELDAGIRGRGNDTWKYYPKKPYRIKFDAKTSLFGEEPNKSWVLLALYNDFSLIKDRMAFGLADAFGTDVFVPSYHYVELYLNGEYQGLYLLTDQVDENKGRLDVKDTITAQDTEVPFFVELDARAPEEGVEGVDWFSAHGMPYAVKYPDPDERYTPEQFAYISNYIQQVDALCRKENVTLSALSEYIDVDSFIDYYLVQELMGQPEINWKSVYMSKSREGKLKMGPVWDFDWSCMGPSTGRYRNDYRHMTEGLRSEDNWFGALYQGSPQFRQAVADRWQQVRPKVDRMLDQMGEECERLEKAATRDRFYWHWYRIGGGFKAYSEDVLEWVEDRAEWFDKAFA